MIRMTTSDVGCLVDDCHAGNHARGLCRVHYSRLRWRGLLDEFARPPHVRVMSPIIDETAVELACGGERVALTVPERRIAVRRLYDRGCSDPRIAYLLHVSVRTVIRYRAHLGLPGLALADITETRRAA